MPFRNKPWPAFSIAQTIRASSWAVALIAFALSRRERRFAPMKVWLRRARALAATSGACPTRSAGARPFERSRRSPPVRVPGDRPSQEQKRWQIGNAEKSGPISDSTARRRLGPDRRDRGQIDSRDALQRSAKRRAAERIPGLRASLVPNDAVLVVPRQLESGRLFHDP